MTLPLRIVQAKATADAEQPCAAAIRASVEDRVQQAAARAAERRIGHHKYVVLITPWQQVALQAAIGEVVRDLIGGAAVALWNAEIGLPCL